MRHAILVAVAAMAFPAVSSAQDTFLKGLTPAGMPSVIVTDDRGVETRGRLIASIRMRWCWSATSSAGSRWRGSSASRSEATR